MKDGIPAASAPPALELLDVAFDSPPPAGAQPEPEKASTPWRIAVAIGIAAALLGGVAVAIVRNPAPAAFASPPAVTPAAETTPDGLAGFAELYLATYLTARGPDRAAQITAFHPAAPDPAADGANRFVRQISTMSSTRNLDGIWEVRLAADVLIHDGVGYQPDGIHHYLVGIADTPQGFAATSLPARIAAPAPAPIPAMAGGTDITDEGLRALVEGFLTAYLTGAGDVRAFVSAGAAIAPITPPPFAAVTTEQMSGAAHGDDTLWIRAVGTAHGMAGEVRIEHYFIVSGSGGAWLIESLAVAPPSASSQPSDPTGTAPTP